jgi:hypothetical protein
VRERRIFRDHRRRRTHAYPDELIFPGGPFTYDASTKCLYAAYLASLDDVSFKREFAAYLASLGKR